MSNVSPVAIPNRLLLVAIFSVLLMVGCSYMPYGPHVDSPIGFWNDTKFHGQGLRHTTTGSINETWTVFIKIDILDEKNATYTHVNEEVFEWPTPLQSGRIYFTAIDKQGRWQGYWVEDEVWNTNAFAYQDGIGNVLVGDPKVCEYEKEESMHWGLVEFEFYPGNNYLLSTWNKCGGVVCLR